MVRLELPLIAVTGASGAQGGSVVRFLLADGGFRVRALTRNPDSPKLKDLAAKGVEIVHADFSDPASLVEAFKGAYGVFAVTNFWEGMDEQKETQDGKALVDAAKTTGVQHFVWSTMETSHDPEIPHWNSKACVNEHLIASGVPRTSLYTNFYYENFVFFDFFRLARGDDGSIVANWPFMATDGPIGAFSVTEIGAYVLEAFTNPQKWINNDLRFISDIFTPRQFVRAVEDVSGEKVDLREVDATAFDNAKDLPGLEALWANMKGFYVKDGNLGRDFELTKQINPRTKTMREYVEANIASLLPK